MMQRLVRFILVGIVLSVALVSQDTEPSRTSLPDSAAIAIWQETVMLSQHIGLASWYGGDERLNSHVAMGHRFNPESLEAAMWDMPFGSMVKVTNLQNGRFVIVRITDRGPSRRFQRRIIDLTRRAFADLAALRDGLIPVVVEQLVMEDYVNVS